MPKLSESPRFLESSLPENTQEKISVLVELDLPLPQIVMSFQQHRDTRSIRPSSVILPQEDKGRSFAKQIEEIGNQLEAMQGSAPRWLKSAHTFVASLTPQQARLISEHPLVKKVWPNREMASP